MNNLGEIVISLVRNDTKVISTIEVFHDRSGFSCGPAEGDWNEETGVVELRQVSFQAAPRPGWTFVNQRFTLTLMGNGLAYGAGDAAGNHITTYLWRENSLPTRGNREIWEGGYPDIGGHVLLTTAYRDDKVNGIAVWVQEGTKGAKGGIGQVSGTWCSAEKRGSIEIVPIKDITDPQPTGPSTRWFLDFTPGKLAVVATDEKGKAAWWAIRRYALP
jgi:hypothetical protein